MCSFCHEQFDCFILMGFVCLELNRNVPISFRNYVDRFLCVIFLRA